MPNIIQSGSVRFVQSNPYTLRVGSIASGSNPGKFTQIGDNIKWQLGQDTTGAAQGIDDIFSRSSSGGEAGILLWDTYLEAKSEANITIIFTPIDSPTTNLPNSTSANMAIGVVACPSGRVEDIDFSSGPNFPTQGGSFILRHGTSDSAKYATIVSPVASINGGTTFTGPLHMARVSVNIVEDDTDDRTGNCSIRGVQNDVFKTLSYTWALKGSTTRSEMSRTSKLFIFLAVCRNTTSTATATVEGRYEVTILSAAPKTPYDEYFGMGIIPKQ